ncbi:MAG: hypothetical protein ACKVP9_11700 [Burkholderiales bacterium]
MEALDHRQRAERIERSIAKCGDADHEMKIEGAMLAGTHWVNFILHRMGVTKGDLDVMHSYMLTVNELRKYSVADAEMMAAIAEIEDIRPAHVRGNVPGGPAAAKRALELLATLRAKAHKLFV